MKRIERILIGLAVAMLLTAPAAAQKVSYDVGDANFSGMKTFAFKNTPVNDSTTDQTAYDSPLVTERTNAAIAAQLEARGLRQDNAHPDVYVTTRRVFKTETTVYSSPYWYGDPFWGGGLGYAYGWRYDPYYTGWGPTYAGGWNWVDERTMGTLVVDVENARTGQLMWRGLAEQHVHEHASPEHRVKRVDKEVTKMFEKFPR
jgi:Domain of unknown function (DUF4136)